MAPYFQRHLEVQALEQAVTEYRQLCEEYFKLRDTNSLSLVEKWGTRRPISLDLYSDSIPDFPDPIHSEERTRERTLLSEIETRAASIKERATRVNASLTRASRRESKELNEARNLFAAALKNERAKEADFQKLFAEYPRILSEALPLQLSPDQIEPLGRPGRTEPDFVIHPDQNSLTGSYGVIELKRPQSQILLTPRKQLIALTSDAQTAIRQCAFYRAEHFIETVSGGEAFFLGNSFFSFVIMGLSDELRDKVTSEILRKQLADLIPDRALQIIPYDSLLRQFDSSGAGRFMLLTPRIVEVHDDFEVDQELGQKLYEAAAANDEPLITSLLHQDAARKAVNYQSPHDGTTPLIWACLHGNAAAVQGLLALGARVNIVDKLGRAALFPAAANCRIEISRLLLEAGADLRALRYRGWTLMLSRAKSDAGFADLMSLLRSYGYWE